MESVFYGIKTLKLDIMIKYSEIKKVAKEKFGNGKYLTDKEDGFRQGAEWALEQVKNCSIPAVVGRSEQLKAFADYVQGRMWEGEDKDLSEFVEDFLSL